MADKEGSESKNDDYVIGHYVQSAVSIVSFIYGVTSWCLIRKFRNFNNYVYLSTILVNILRLAVLSLPLISENSYIALDVQLNSFYFFLYIFLSTVYNYWLVVMCYMFYTDIVKVFNYNNVRRKYVLSTLFAWGMPVISLLICILIFFLIAVDEEGDNEHLLFLFPEFAFFATCSILPAFINVILFIPVLFSLFPCNDKNSSTIPKTQTKKQKFNRLCISTVLFLLSNIFVSTFLLWDLLTLPGLVRSVSLSVQIIVLALFLPLHKSNRGLVHEYFERGSKRVMS